MATEFTFSITFPPVEETPFGAYGVAAEWLRARGYSIGSLCGNLPIGVKRGRYVIAKWRNLTSADREQLDGQLTSEGWRYGSVKLELREEPKLALA